MPDQKESLYFGDGLPQSSTQVVSDSRQQDTKQWDSHQSIENAEELSSFRLGRDVTKTWHLGGGGRGLRTRSEFLKSVLMSGVFIACAAYLPMVVIIVPEKKKALARSHWLTKVLLLIGSTPAPMALTTSWDVQSSEISSWVKFKCFYLTMISISLFPFPVFSIQ